MPTILERRQERADLVKKAQAILTKAEEEKRKITAEEGKEFDNIMKDVDERKIEIDRLEKAEAISKELEANINKVTKPDPEHKGTENREVEYRGIKFQPNKTDTPEYNAAFSRFLKGGQRILNSEDARALQADVDVEGGYIVTPQMFVLKLIQALDDAVSIRKLATVIPLGKAVSLGCPTLATDIDDAQWTPEIVEAPEDTSMRFGKRELNPNPLAKLIKISKELIRVAALPIEDIVRSRMLYKFSLTENKVFLTGSGAGQPLGLFTASNDGISTGRDIVTGANDGYTADGLITILYTLKTQYRRNARWLLHRDGIAKIRKLKTGDGVYIWIPGLIGNEPDRLLGLPIVEDENVPRTFSAGEYVGVVGDFSNYWIADALDMSIQVLTELYARTNQNGYIGRRKLDGMPVLEEAFVRAKCGT